MALYAALAFVMVIQTGIAILPMLFHASPTVLEAVFLSAMVLRMMIAVGALVLVHNLYTAATPPVLITVIFLRIYRMYFLAQITGSEERAHKHDIGQRKTSFRKVVLQSCQRVAVERKVERRDRSVPRSAPTRA